MRSCSLFADPAIVPGPGVLGLRSKPVAAMSSNTLEYVGAKQVQAAHMCAMVADSLMETDAGG